MEPRTIFERQGFQTSGTNDYFEAKYKGAVVSVSKRGKSERYSSVVRMPTVGKVGRDFIIERLKIVHTLADHGFSGTIYSNIKFNASIDFEGDLHIGHLKVLFGRTFYLYQADGYGNFGRGQSYSDIGLLMQTVEALLTRGYQPFIKNDLPLPFKPKATKYLENPIQCAFGNIATNCIEIHKPMPLYTRCSVLGVGSVKDDLVVVLAENPSLDDAYFIVLVNNSTYFLVNEDGYYHLVSSDRHYKVDLADYNMSEENFKFMIDAISKYAMKSIKEIV